MRALEVTDWPTEYLGSDWPGCRQVFRLGRERRCGGGVEIEVVFGITSLARDRAGAAELLGLTRAHWGIENGLHFRRDGTLREDAGRVRRGAEPQVMAILRNMVIYLRRLSGRASLAAATRYHVCHPEKSLELRQPQDENETALPPPALDLCRISPARYNETAAFLLQSLG